MQNNHNTHESNQHRMLQIHNENTKFGAFKCFSSFIFRYIRLYVLVQLCMFGFVYLCARFVFSFCRFLALLHIVLLFHICVRFQISFYDRSSCISDAFFERFECVDFYGHMPTKRSISVVFFEIIIVRECCFSLHASNTKFVSVTDQFVVC